MKYIIFGLIAFVAVVATVAERQVRVLTPMDLVAIAPFGTTDLSVFTKKDLLVHPQSQIDYDVLNYAIRRRNNEGVYEKVANISRELVQQPVLITNGKWIGLLDTSTGGPMDMFHIDENNVISNASTLDISLFAGGYLLSDDTVVSFDPPTEYPDSLEGMYSLNVTLRSRQYDSTKNAWTPINGTDLTFTGFVYMSGDFSTYRVYDEYMVIGRFTPASSDFIVNVYERLANKSWNFIEAVPITGGPAGSLLRNIFYNGIDTIVVGWNDQDSGGIVEISFVSKKNGTWTAQNFTSESVGYAPIPFGTSGTFLNANTFLQGTGIYYENDGSNKNARGALIFTRTEDGDWEPTIDLEGSPAVVFGAGLGVNDHDIIVSGMQSLGSQDITYYTITRCFLDPINVTCHNLELDDCSEISPNQLYTINNPECGATSVQVDGLGFDKNGGQTRLTFTRGYGSSAVHCNATVACPNKVQNPVPVGGAPVAESVTSSSNSLQLGLFALLMSISYV